MKNHVKLYLIYIVSIIDIFYIKMTYILLYNIFLYLNKKCLQRSIFFSLLFRFSVAVDNFIIPVFVPPSS
jgi:hypothetical protein